MSQELTFGGWLRQRRTELGVTRDELSERVGFSRDLLRKLESGERRPSGQIAYLLADYFHVPGDEREAFVTFARIGHAATASLAPDTAKAGNSGRQISPWRRAYVRQTNLPALLTPLIGRDREVSATCEQMLQPRTRLLTLTGAPGIGKTSLGLKVAWDLVEHFEDGVYFVDLAPVTDPDLVLATIAHALGLKEDATSSIERVVSSFVRERKMLLLLDNFEQVLDAAISVVDLLKAGPWLKALVTSREALHVRGEHVSHVPSLALPERDLLPAPKTLLDYSAIELFVERARAVLPTFALTENNAEEAVAVCRGLDGLPLAIELAAARASYLSPQEIRAALESRLKLLVVGARDVPPRHRTLHAAIEWSYRLLEDSEQALFRTLGVFVGSFLPEAAAAVYAGQGGAFSVALLQSLVDRNLLLVERHAEQTVFRMLETMREFALARLLDEGEESDARTRHMRYYLALAEGASPELRHHRQFEWLRALERELDNIRAALQWATERDAGGAGMCLLKALWWFWELQDYTQEGLRWSLQMLSAAQEAEPSLAKGRVLAGAGVFAYKINDFDLATSLLDEGLALSRAYDDAFGVASALKGLGLVARNKGEFATGRRLIEESLAVSRQLGDKSAIADATYALGVVLQHEADYPQARSLLEESLSLYEEMGDQALSVYVRTWLGDLARCEEDYGTARRMFEENYALSEKLWVNPDKRNVLHNMGHVAHSEGHHKEGVDLFIGSIEEALDVGDYSIVGACLAGLAGVAASLRQPERAARLFGAADKLVSYFAQADLLAYNRNMAATRAQLSDEAFGVAWEEGRAMTLEETVAYALAG